MAKRKVTRSKKTKKKKRKFAEDGKETLTARARLGKLINTKEDVYKLGERFGPLESFWCDNYHQFINMLACIHRKYVFKYHEDCSRCSQIFNEFAEMLGDRIEELWEEHNK
jgi:hypothetical protein